MKQIIVLGRGGGGGMNCRGGFQKKVQIFLVLFNYDCPIADHDNDSAYRMCAYSITWISKFRN